MAAKNSKIWVQIKNIKLKLDEIYKFRETGYNHSLIIEEATFHHVIDRNQDTTTLSRF